VLSLDGPSGLDFNTGRQATPCVHADATMTLALPKTGLAGSEVTGRLYLADISVPPLPYRRMGMGGADAIPLWADCRASRRPSPVTSSYCNRSGPVRLRCRAHQPSRPGRLPVPSRLAGEPVDCGLIVQVPVASSRIRAATGARCGPRLAPATLGIRLPSASRPLR